MNVRVMVGRSAAASLVVTALTGVVGAGVGATTVPDDTAASDEPVVGTMPADTVVPEGPLQIGALWLDASAFYTAVEAGVNQAFDGLDVSVLASNSNSDESLEAEQIDTLIGAGVDAIILSAVNADASLAQVQRATEAGIPVICYNTCVTGYQDNVYAYITGSHLQQGSSVGTAAAAWLVAEGITEPQIGVIACEQYEACQQRRQGFEEAVLAELPGAVFVATEEALEVDAAAQSATDMLSANPDIDLIYAEAGNMVSGAAVAIRESGSSATIFGHDITTDTANLLVEGTVVKYINAIIGEDMGANAAQLALRAIAGEPLDTVLINQDPTDFSSDDTDGVQAWIDAHPEG